ncbi:autotransporter outer membrane beta-barrel domain-containing protein [Mesorhizobium sp. BAC0120]|uniref:autotransporter outer membrane beta-barrel domain-containing protein n=1 Tax=Mesorhizobium sp. BAC0120 TaxID=3090670 RepID=UPI00298C5E41|nr:autotransporter outer membrane beta-barrel domain-containing protein [Mesorhizobium sp. BAC0120]MDW6024373.1 autotransporter outer membrane beta-barrel domain-containing protein [Mesorhizobium sp. BAC0120]
MTMMNGSANASVLGLRQRLVLGTALATSAFVGGYRGYVRRAYAACAPVGGPYICSGATTTTQTLTGTPLTVTTAPGFSIDTSVSGGNAFTLTGTGGLTFTDENASAIKGADSGIAARNDTSGELSITASGTVEGTSGVGIYAYAGSSTGDLTITAADVSGHLYGIQAGQFGIGALSITATGTVEGATLAGILAYNPNGTDLTIAAAEVSGDLYGIRAGHFGSGAMSITATGTVEGLSGFGIYARNQNGRELTIAAADVSGGSTGIYARHYGSGALSITTTGTVEGTNGDGISVNSAGNATDLTIEAKAVSGGRSGIYVRHYGSGALSITASGTVQGTSGGGIRVRDFHGNGLTIKAAGVSGGSDGINVRHYGSGALSITASGTVVGSRDNGVFALAGTGTTDLTIAAADVSGGSIGIDAIHSGSGALSITATGTVEGTSGHGIYVRNNSGTGVTIAAAAVSGDAAGIYARNEGGGALSIAATGKVEGANGAGIFARSLTPGDLTITAADVSGRGDGIDARAYGSGALSVTATGTVTGTDSHGIRALNKGTGALSITASGIVTGAGGYGVYARNYGKGLTIAAAAVNGKENGILASHFGGGALSITASGTVAGTGGYGIFAFADTGSTDLTITAAGVSGNKFGIYALNRGSGALSITSTGTVTGTTDDGIFARNDNGTHLTIKAAAVSGAGGIYALQYGSGALSITSTGNVTGTTSDGIYAVNVNGTDLTIETADVSGDDGIVAGHYGSGALSITATGTVRGTDGDGIFALNNSAAIGSTTKVTVGNGAAVGGSVAGVELVSTAGRATSLENAGAISGGTGVVAQTAGPLTIINSGMITGTGGAAIDLTKASGSSTINQQAGTITGDILLSAAAKMIVTGGTIDGDIVGFGGSFTLAAPNAITGVLDTSAGTVDFNGTLSAATLTVKGGKMMINGASELTGGATVQGGILSVNGSLSGGITVLGGRLQGTGIVLGDTRNAVGGVVAPGNSIGTLTVKGNYTGGGGTLEIEAALGGDASPSDRLVVTGNTSGRTDVRVINRGGGGAQTVEGIKVIDVGGASAGTFTLIGDHVFQGRPAVIAGAYSYTLQKNGISTPADGDWYLRSALTASDQPVYQPGAPLYEAYAGVLQSFNEPGTVQQRLGNGSWTVQAQGADGLSEEVTTAPGFGVWGTIEGAQGSFDPKTSTTGTNYDVSTWQLETGLDMPLYEQETGMLVGGVSFHYGRISSEIGSPFGDGSIDSTGYGLGGTLTWYGSTGFYVDGQARVTWFDSDIYSDTLARTLASGNDGLGYALSLETGQRVPVSQRWSLTPQAQLAYAAVEFDDFTDPFGAAVSLEDGDSLLGRLGLSADYEDAWTDAAGQTSRAHIYGIANLYYDFLDGSRVDVSGVDLVSENEALWGGLGLGGSLSFADGKYTLYGEALARTSLQDFGDSHVLSGSIGFRVNW